MSKAPRANRLQVGDASKDIEMTNLKVEPVPETLQAQVEARTCVEIKVIRLHPRLRLFIDEI